MRIGLGLPNAMPEGIDRGLLIDWARLGDEGGFEVLGVIDRPDYDSWEPLATLAGVAAVDESDSSGHNDSSATQSKPGVSGENRWL